MISTDPLVPVPLAEAGATIVTGCTAMGLRTAVVPLVQVSDPVVKTSSGAVVRVNVTV